jgi:hypothetical protein
MSVRYIDYDDSIGDSLSAINLNFSTIEESYEDINTSLNLYAPLLEEYLNINLEKYTEISKAISNNKIFWEQARTLVAANSAVWLQPLVLLYPCIIENSSFILTKDITDSVILWINRYFPVTTTSGETNYIEDQIAYIGITFRASIVQDNFTDNSLFNRILTLKCIVKDCKWIPLDIASKPLDSNECRSDTVVNVTKTPLPTPFNTPQATPSASPVPVRSFQLIFTKKEPRFWDGKNFDLISLRNAKLENNITFEDLIPESDGSYKFLVNANQCAVDVYDQNQQLIRALSTGDNTKLTNKTVIAYPTSNDILIKHINGGWGGSTLEIFANVYSKLPSIDPTPTPTSLGFSMQLTTLAGDYYDGVVEINHTGTIQALFDSASNSQFVITIKNINNKDIFTDFAAKNTLWSVNYLPAGTYTFEVINYTVGISTGTKLAGELFISNSSGVSYLKINNNKIAFNQSVFSS